MVQKVIKSFHQEISSAGSNQGHGRTAIPKRVIRKIVGQKPRTVKTTVVASKSAVRAVEVSERS